ncbi:DUF4391 domain-containing protein [Chromobacterium haemolyticum]|uniref:DUF4391 domain-containing protein n=1 Tax=Chromobacterium haemolyticum TaxID=394935 RepID=UPI0017470BFE|nr:DUF4391 domain-containing protein [Chromobacterium haemolyticum]QOD82947.1 DUF4391 domain-containing protein [Chromobacterium haemolyticum]
MPTAFSKLTASALIDALGLPPASRLDQRIPKKLLVEHGAPTAADRKLIQDGIEEAKWVAAIKPANSAIPEYFDETRNYLELSVLMIRTRQIEPGTVHWLRLAGLIHRAIPYPVVLVLESQGVTSMSLVHIRSAQNEVDKTVLDGDLLMASFDAPCPDQQAFLAALALSQQPRTDLHAVYQGWMDTLTAWQAMALTGRFKLSENPNHAANRRSLLRQCRELDIELAQLEKLAGKAKQMACQVEINQKIHTLRLQRQQLAASA